MKTKKVRRVFSVEFKKEKVSQIEKGELSVSQLAKILDMSPNPIYLWVREYGSGPVTEKIVIETESDYIKCLDLQKKGTEMERLIARQQLKIAYYEQIIEEVQAFYGEDPKKKFLKK